MEIRQAQEKDEKGIRELFYSSFRKEMSHEEWIWKYKQSPYGSVSYVAIDNKNIIAHYGGIKFSFYMKGRTLWAYQKCDVMTHPGYRGKVFSKSPPIVQAGKMFYEENSMDFAFGFPSERHARLQRLVLGGSDPERISVFNKDLQHTFKMKWRYKIEVGWDALNSIDLYELWNRCYESSSLSIVKNSSYIAWRYRKHPSRNYTPVVFRSKFFKKIEGLVIVKCNDNLMSVLDYFIPQKSIFKLFWNHLESFALSLKATSITTWANREESVSDFLIDLGFSINEGIPYAVRIINHKEMVDTDFYSKYCYRMGDYDAS